MVTGVTMIWCFVTITTGAKTSNLLYFASGVLTTFYVEAANLTRLGNRLIIKVLVTFNLLFKNCRCRKQK